MQQERRFSYSKSLLSGFPSYLTTLFISLSADCSLSREGLAINKLTREWPLQRVVLKTLEHARDKQQIGEFTNQPTDKMMQS